MLTNVGQLVKRFCAPPSHFVVDMSGVPDLGEPARSWLEFNAIPQLQVANCICMLQGADIVLQ